jgi:drug/metabolite transporter (DMT)-like permease
VSFRSSEYGVVPMRLALIAALLGLQVALALLGVLNKDAVTVVPPLTLEATRRVAAGLLLVVLIAARRSRLRPSRQDLVDAVLPGILGFGFGRACVMVGLSLTSPTNVALIDSGAPAVALLLAVVVGVERPPRFAVIGSLVALAGVVGFVLVGSGLGAPNLGDVITLGSPLAWGGIYVYLARRGEPGSLLRRTAWFSVAGGAALAVPGFALNASALPLLLDGRVLPALGLGIIIGLVENWLTFRAILVLGAVQTAEFEYLVPALTAGAAFVLLGLPVMGAQIAAGLIIVLGLLAAGRARASARLPERTFAGDGLPLAAQPCVVC